MTGGRQTVAAAPLSGAGFAPFGTVIALDEPGGRVVNEGRGRRRDLPDLDHAAEAACHRLALYDLAPNDPVPIVRCFERHPLSAQLFAPISCLRYLVVVAPDNAAGEPDCGQARAFVGTVLQAVIYRRGVWHAPLMVLDEAGRFLMGQWESGAPHDCVEFALAENAALKLCLPA